MDNELRFPSRFHPIDPDEGKDPKDKSLSEIEAVQEDPDIVDINKRRNSLGNIDSGIKTARYFVEMAQTFGPGFVQYLDIVKKLKPLVGQIPQARQARLLGENSGMVAKYEDEDIIGWLNKATEKDYAERPIFFWALVQEAGIRKLDLKKDSTEKKK